jgi:hypothetical protein
MPVFDIAMLIMCSIIKGSTEWKLYTHKQFYMNTKSETILHTEYFILLKVY